MALAVISDGGSRSKATRSRRRSRARVEKVRASIASSRVTMTQLGALVVVVREGSYAVAALIARGTAAILALHATFYWGWRESYGRHY